MDSLPPELLYLIWKVCRPPSKVNLYVIFLSNNNLRKTLGRYLPHIQNSFRNVLVMGISGDGKSSLINLILGSEEAPIRECPQHLCQRNVPCTKNFHTYVTEIKSYVVSLIDAPGMNKNGAYPAYFKKYPNRPYHMVLFVLENAHLTVSGHGALSFFLKSSFGDIPIIAFVNCRYTVPVNKYMISKMLKTKSVNYITAIYPTSGLCDTIFFQKQARDLLIYRVGATCSEPESYTFNPNIIYKNSYITLKHLSTGRYVGVKKRFGGYGKLTKKPYVFSVLSDHEFIPLNNDESMRVDFKLGTGGNTILGKGHSKYIKMVENGPRNVKHSIWEEWNMNLISYANDDEIITSGDVITLSLKHTNYNIGVSSNKYLYWSTGLRRELWKVDVVG